MPGTSAWLNYFVSDSGNAASLRELVVPWNEVRTPTAKTRTLPSQPRAVPWLRPLPADASLSAPPCFRQSTVPFASASWRPTNVPSGTTGTFLGVAGWNRFDVNSSVAARCARAARRQTVASTWSCSRRSSRPGRPRRPRGRPLRPRGRIGRRRRRRPPRPVHGHDDPQRPARAAAHGCADHQLCHRHRDRLGRKFTVLGQRRTSLSLCPRGRLSFFSCCSQRPHPMSIRSCAHTRVCRPTKELKSNLIRRADVSVMTPEMTCVAEIVNGPSHHP
jgi:hypothetical protein